jgi:uncharacterized protein (TIGR02453 family)
MKYFSPDFLQFFKDLAANNNKDWFDVNRKRYESVVKKPMEAFVADALKELYKSVEVKPGECIFRINRDIRFSKDKTPYKLHTSAVISNTGKKVEEVGGIYVELGPEKLAFAGGAYQPDKDGLMDIRDAIVAKPKEWQKVSNNPDFKKYWGEIQGERNKVLAAEYKSIAAEVPSIANKQFYYWTELDSKLIISDQLMSTVMEHYHAATPVRQFLERASKR